MPVALLLHIKLADFSPLQYGFLDFVSHEAAAQVLATLNGSLIPGFDKPLRLNWAGLGSSKGSEGKYFPPKEHTAQIPGARSH